jgi:hypothetical protein
MIAFIDDHRGTHGVEPICKDLPIAPSTYHAHVAKRRNPAKLSMTSAIGRGLVSSDHRYTPGRGETRSLSDYSMLLA